MAEHPTINIEVLHVWDLATGESPALTGLAGNMSATLTRFPTTSSQASATETVTIAEIGSTGFYAVTYTPTLAQVYKLVVEESSLSLITSWEDAVADAPSTAVADNAYCTEAEVVAFAQMGDYTASTVPTETEVLGFMEKRAGQIYSKLREVMGTQAVGPASSTAYTTEIDTTSDIGFALGRQCALANAMGAAMDALEAAGASAGPSRTERVQELGVAFMSALDSLKEPALQYIGRAVMTVSHVTAGEVSLPSTTSTERDFEVTQDTQW